MTCRGKKVTVSLVDDGGWEKLTRYGYQMKDWIMEHPNAGKKHGESC